MVITVLGASGQTGKELVRQTLAVGYTVHGLVHHEGGLEPQSHLKLFVGDATKAEDVAVASTGADAIISVLGTNSAKSSLMTDAVNAVLAASKQTGVKRFILLSNFAAGDHKLGGGLKLVGGLAKRIFKDKITSEDRLKKSRLDWTIVHATRLTNDPLGTGVRVVPKTEAITPREMVPRSEVAAWMLREAQDNAYVRKSVTISES